MALSELSQPLDQETLTHSIESGSLPDWAITRYKTFRETVLNSDPPFPCYFATDAEKNGDARYIFCRSTCNPDSLNRLVDALAQYINQYDSIEGRTTCAIFFQPPENSFSEAKFRERFWNVFQYLHDHDPCSWPEEIPRSPANPEWEYSFGGEPMFVVGRAPFYDQRQSRYTPHGLEITVQPRGTLADLTADTEAGKEARRIIRDRLREYDNVPQHPDIGDFSDPGSREWKQYLLPKRNSESLEACPLNISSSE